MVVRIVPSEEDMLAGLGQRARRYIRKGQRDGVTVQFEQYSDRASRVMYALMGSAAGGNGVPGMRRLEYHQRLWREFADAGLGEFAFGVEEGVPVVGAFVIRLGARGVYKDGGSDPRRGSQGAAYVVQWEIMKRLASQGASEYDFWGSPPSDRMDDPSHPYYGVGVFKQAFTKDVIDRIGVYDYALRRRRYVLWTRVVYPLISRYYRRHRSSFY